MVGAPDCLSGDMGSTPIRVATCKCTQVVRGSTDNAVDVSSNLSACTIQSCITLTFWFFGKPETDLWDKEESA